MDREAASPESALGNVGFGRLSKQPSTTSADIARDWEDYVLLRGALGASVLVAP